MAITVTRNVGSLLLAIWLIVSGLAGLIALPLPPLVMPVLALVAGIAILVGRSRDALLGEELHQLRIDPVGMGPQHAVRATG